MALFTVTFIMIGYYFYVEPYAAKFDNQLEIWNEVCLIFLAYHIFCFTDWVPDPTWRYRIGFSCVMWTLIGLISNMVVIMAETFRLVKM